jgi:hypothetical protein
MAQQHPLIGPPGSTIVTNGRNLRIQYQGLDFVRVRYQEITLNAGGSRTQREQHRLNQAARQFDLGFRISVSGGGWVVQTDQGDYRYADGMTVHRSPAQNHEYVTYS